MEELSSQHQDPAVEAVRGLADRETGSKTGRGQRGYYQGPAPHKLLLPAMRKPIALHVNLKSNHFKKTNNLVGTFRHSDGRS